MDNDRVDEFIASMVVRGEVDIRLEGDDIKLYAVPSDSPDSIWHTHLREVEDSVSEMMKLGLIKQAGVGNDGSPTYTITDAGRELLDS